MGGLLVKKRGESYHITNINKGFHYSTILKSMEMIYNLLIDTNITRLAHI